MLVLGQGNALLGSKAADGLIQLLQLLPQSSVCQLFIGLMSAMGTLFGAQRAVAGVALRVAGGGIAFQLLQNRDRGLAGAEGGCRCSYGQHAHHHDQSQ